MGVEILVFLFALLLLLTVIRFVSKLFRWRCFDDLFYAQQLFKVPEWQEDHQNQNLQQNQLYNKVYTYLINSQHQDSCLTNLFTGLKPNDVLLRSDPLNQTICDTFLGAKMSWTNNSDDKTFVLKMRKKDKHRVLRPYLQHILTVAAEETEVRNQLRMYMNLPTHGCSNKRWSWVHLNHPATFDTVVMDVDVKKRVKSDLELFLKSKQYYHNLGRLWKRSYLLYGASGTGKSSFVAAMAKFLGFDVYDVDLSRVKDDADLKMLLLETTPRSVIVVEALDRLLKDKSTAVTLCGVLNFMDGIISCCGEERLMVFTMNSKHGIDEMVMRPGRIDVHIEFPACDFSAFKSLVNIYLGVKEHKLFGQVEEMIQNRPSLSPAEISEILLSNRSSPSRALKSVISALQSNKKMGQSQRLSEDGLGQCTENKSGLLDRDNSVKDSGKLSGLMRMLSRRREQALEF